MRYKVSNESETGHCCFVASVLDSRLTDELDPPVCETFSLENAHKVAEALNTADAARSDANQEKKEKQAWQEFRICNPDYVWEVWCLYSARTGKYQVWELEVLNGEEPPYGLPLAELVMTEEGKAIQLWSRIKDG